MAQPGSGVPPWMFQVDTSPKPAGTSAQGAGEAWAAEFLHWMRQLYAVSAEQLKLQQQLAGERQAQQQAERQRQQALSAALGANAQQARGALQQVLKSVLAELADYLAEHGEDLADEPFVLTEFMDRYGPRLAFLTTILNLLGPPEPPAQQTS